MAAPGRLVIFAPSVHGGIVIADHGECPYKLMRGCPIENQRGALKTRAQFSGRHGDNR
jgi:hypothetical protein